MIRFMIGVLLAVLTGSGLLVADTYDERTLVLIRVPDQAARDFIVSSRIDVVNARAAWVKALLRPEEFRLIEGGGLSYEVLHGEMERDRALWAEADRAAGTRSPDYYYTASAFDTVNPGGTTLMRHLLDLHNAYPDITRLYDIGDSSNHAVNHYDIIAIQVTRNPDAVEAEPKIRVYANIHGDEKGGLMVACEALDWILANYATDPRAQKLVDGSEMWFIPMGNPEGNAASSRYNANGVDLNRNFSGPVGHDDGAYPFSEPETAAIRDLTEVTGKRFATGLSFHGGEICFNSIWNYTSDAPSDEPIFWSDRTGGEYSGCSTLNGCLTIAPDGLAEAYQKGCTTPGFWFTEGADWYPTTGDTNDWSYSVWSALDTTLEVTSIKTPSTSQIPVFCAEHLPAVINYMLKTFQGAAGLLTDSATGAPLDGTVTAVCTSCEPDHPYQAVPTDPAVGDFHRVLPPGTYTVTCSAPGYDAVSVPGVVVAADATTAVNCAMSVPCANNPTAVSVSPGGPLVLCPGSSQALTATPTGGTGPFTYQWYDGQDPIGGASSSSYAAADAGTHHYTCRIAGSGCAGGVQDATPTSITWQAEPTFAGLAAVTNPASATCTLNLAWAAGASNCAGDLRYRIYRSTTPGFTPDAANRIAQDLDATSYSDLDNLVSGTTYYYIVRAVDTSNAAEETNTVEKSGKPTGGYTDGTWTAGAETGDPGLALNTPWAVSATYERTGSASYSTTATPTPDATGACGGLTTPALVLGADPVLSYYHMYSTESGYDGGRVEISTNGGTSWSPLTPSPAYGGTITSSGNACGWNTGTACYIGASTGFGTTWQAATIDLSAYGGQTVLLRWNFTSDSGVSGSGSYPGWYIDDIRITHVQVPGTCATASVPSVQFDAAQMQAELCGDGDDTVEPGEDWSVSVRLHNTGGQTATSVFATLAINAASAAGAVLLAGNPGEFGDIPPGGTATDAFEFRVDAGAACGESVLFDLVALGSAEQGYPDQPGAFSVAVGVDTAGGSETAGQASTPLSAANGAADSDLIAAFTLAPPADGATLTYGGGYAPKPGESVVLFGPDEMTADIGLWTPAGMNTEWSAGTAHCYPHTDGLARIYSRNGSLGTLTLTSPIQTTGLAGVIVTADYSMSSTGGSPQLRLQWSPDGEAWTTAFAAPVSTAFTCGHAVALPAGAEGLATLHLRFTFAQTENSNRYGYVDHVGVTATGPATGSWTANARVSLVDPGGAVTVLKAFGASDAEPYDVRASYSGPGTYVLRLEENGGGTATVTGGSMQVLRTAESECDLSSCGSPALPGEVPNTSVRWTSATAMQWSAAAGATGYTIYRGVAADLPKLLTDEAAGFYDSCPRASVAVTDAAGLGDSPAAGSFYWYLVAGTNGAGTGPVGSATGPMARVPDPTADSCP